MSTEITHVLLTNRYIYKTKHTQEEVEHYLMRLIKPVGMDRKYNYNLTGEYAKGKFKLMRRGGVIIIDSWDREPVTIYGKVIKTDSDLVNLDVEIKSNFINILFISICLIGSYIFLMIKLIPPPEEVSIWFVFAPITIALFMWIQAYFVYTYYKLEFEKALRLEPVDTPVGSRIRL